MTKQLVKVTINRKFQTSRDGFCKYYRLNNNGELSLYAKNAIMKYFRFSDCELTTDDLHTNTKMWLCCGEYNTHVPTHVIRIKKI